MQQKHIGQMASETGRILSRTWEEPNNQPEDNRNCDIQDYQHGQCHAALTSLL
jgi:hypothetical protein